MAYTMTIDYDNNGQLLYRDRRPVATREEKAKRRAKAEAQAAVAMAEHDRREATKQANLERLRAERLAREGQR